MSYQVEIRKITEQHVVSIRTQCHVAELGAILAEILPEVWRYCRNNGIAPSGPPFTRYHGFADDRVDIEAGLPVPSPLAGEGRIAAGTLPGGQVATTTHMGPYDKLPHAHDALHEWIEQHMKNSAGPQWEVYWTDPGREPNPENWKTELMWPIK
ncbi:MAG TPA: GyrI-like domain-containing protein [Candidatus Krumholzibacteria bacterium]|nr:GyrI-like domain-containing protein [Candidatus Krumholzibacteria bacterium]